MNFISAFSELDKLYESVDNDRTKSLYNCTECGFEAELFDDEFDGSCPNCHDHHGAFNKCEESLEEAKSEEEEVVEDEVPADEESQEQNTVEEDEQEEVVNKSIVLECAKCGALVIKDESEVTIDEESDLANVGEECAYCEESEGFKALGTFEPYVVETVDDEAVEEAEAAEDDVVEEALKEETTEDEELEEGIFDKKKNSAEMNNARRDFSAEVEAITGGDSLADMAYELTSKLRDSIDDYKYYEEKKANHTTDQISLQRVYKSKAEQILKLYAELIKTLKKPTNFYAPYSVISSAIRKVLGGYSSDSDILSRIRDYGEKLNKIGAIKADKKVKSIELADFYKKVVNGLDGDYRLLQKKPTHTLFN